MHKNIRFFFPLLDVNKIKVSILGVRICVSDESIDSIFYSDGL